MPEARATKVTMLYANRLDGRGGIERQAEYMLRAMNEMDGAPTVHYLRTRYAEAGPLIHLTPLLAWLRFVLHAVTTRPDVVHIHIARRGSTWRKVLFGKTARMIGIKLILHLHGSSYDVFFEGIGSARRRAVLSLFGSAHRIVTLGQYWRRFVVETLEVPADRVVIIDNGAPLAPRADNVDAQPPRLAFVGAVGERKGVDLLLHAFAAIPADIEARLDIAGGGDISRYYAQAKELNIHDRVTFHGWLREEEVGNLLSVCSLFVLPSRMENQPVAILEAMARGLPVIATDVGAIPEVVANGKTGLIVPPDDIISLKNALSELVENPTRRAEMGSRAQSVFQERYSIARNAQQFHKLYEEVIQPAQNSRQLLPFGDRS